MSVKKPAPAPEGRNYHHGHLRTALLAAAREELAEKGVESFTLRSCARRAGVSHAAPAHHFGDVTGLLTAVAIEAYGQLAASIRSEVNKVDRGSIEHPIATALGYAFFALEHPDEFKLMFRRERLDKTSRELHEAGQLAFGLAADAVGAFYGNEDPLGDPHLTRRVIALWSLAHGTASLLVAQQLGPVSDGRKLAQSLLPDMVRELFGVSAENAADDLALILRTSEAAEKERNG